MQIKMSKSVSGYVWGGVRLPAVGGVADVPDELGDRLIASGHASPLDVKAPAKKAAPVETASVDAEAETADVKPRAKTRKG